jgi:hypothetical protein
MKKKSFYLKDESGENYYSFDCDFSKVGWYKIYQSNHPIGNNPLFSSSKNITLYHDDWP